MQTASELSDVLASCVFLKNEPYPMEAGPGFGVVLVGNVSCVINAKASC